MVKRQAPASVKALRAYERELMTLIKERPALGACLSPQDQHSLKRQLETLQRNFDALRRDTRPPPGARPRR